MEIHWDLSLGDARDSAGGGTVLDGRRGGQAVAHVHGGDDDAFGYTCVWQYMYFVRVHTQQGTADDHE